MNIELLREEIKRDEGYMQHAYNDHLGYLTIGYGRLIDRRKGGGLSEFEAEYLLQNDIDKIVTEITIRIPWIEGVSDARQRALANMAYQLGVPGLMGFKKMLENMRLGLWNQAANEALDSLWAEQTPERAKRVSEMIRKG